MDIALLPGGGGEGEWYTSRAETEAITHLHGSLRNRMRFYNCYVMLEAAAAIAKTAASDIKCRVNMSPPVSRPGITAEYVHFIIGRRLLMA